MKKFTLAIAAALCAAGMSAQTFGNPVDKDGNYIVKWDPATESFAAANDWEVDETFIFAVDVTGTGWETALATPGRGSIGRSVAYDLFTTSAPEDATGKMNIDGRLMHIKGNVYGMTVNFFQQHTTRFADEGLEPSADYSSYGCLTPGYVVTWNSNLFPFGWSADNPGAEWWDAISAPIQDQFAFASAPYTGTKTSPEFFYGDLADDDYCPFEGLDAGAYHSMCDGWGGYAAPEHLEAALGSNAISNVMADNAETVAVRFYNLQGVQLTSEPSNGIFIRQNIKADGSVKAVKVVK